MGESLDNLKNVLENNPNLYFKFKELVLRIKEHDESTLEEATQRTLQHIFKKYPDGSWEIKEMDSWFDEANKIMSTKFVFNDSKGVIRHRGKNGGVLSLEPTHFHKKIVINPNELDLVEI